MKRFEVNDKVKRDVIEKLKSVNLVSDDAVFSRQNKSNLRSRVCYRDFDFLEFLGTTKHTSQVINEAISFLLNEIMLESLYTFNDDTFYQYRDQVKAYFDGNWSSISPMMEKLIYALSEIKSGDTFVEIGSFWGNSLAWFSGPHVNNHQCTFYGVEIDEDMHNLAMSNFQKLGIHKNIIFVNQNGLEFLRNFNKPIDMLYLEAKSEEDDSHYIQFLNEIYPRLPIGAWVIAHDTTRFLLKNKMERYLDFVRDSDKFSHSFNFDIDNFGLELSIK